MRTHGTYAPRSLELRQLARWASRIFWIAIMYLAPVGVLLVASLISALELDG